MFVHERFSVLKEIRDRTNTYLLKGGINVKAVRNFSKHYLPWLPLPAVDPITCQFDIQFYIDSANTIRSGPILSGLLFPLFNDACDAYREIANLINQRIASIAPLTWHTAHSG